ncbi:2588_t:CDS:2 [Rhizophagus irregularis]|nr:2588_t:CDS:2 [Rhizophagus irregularis]
MFPPSKKHIHPEDSNTLQKLICELSSDITRISEIKERKALDKESALKEKHLDHYKKTEEEHEAQKRVNDEVRGQLPKEVTNDDKIGRVVNIRQIKTFSASSIAKLSWDDILYVATQVKKNNRRDPAPLGAPQETSVTIPRTLPNAVPPPFHWPCACDSIERTRAGPRTVRLLLKICNHEITELL